jgi:hypothetical protein
MDSTDKSATMLREVFMFNSSAASFAPLQIPMLAKSWLGGLDSIEEQIRNPTKNGKS